ncbi:MAG: right-handed parallel beta-helix repeat-containing protein [Candidatus Bathyarchaeota archaeon]|nr:right-handed parallel beta-helix repeat-containing protein [Candidatus Bathyarchaeota archaeon]
MKSVVLPTLSLLLISMFPFGSGEIPSLSFSLTPYVMFANSATETIRFETNVNANFTIDYGTTASYGHIVSRGTLDIMHEINITGLLPNTLYYYNVTIKSPDGQTSSYDSTFTTAVDGGTSASNFVFAVLGDSRADSGDGVDTNEFPTLINHAVNNYNPRFIIMTGDVVTTSGNDYNTIKQAWKTYTDQVVSISDHIPIFNALGNHEHVTASTPNALLRYQEIWMHPHNGDGESGYYDEVTFWQEFGNSLFIFTSTEEPSFSPRIQSNQLTWLNNTLRKRGYTHKFVFFHRPICGTTRSGTVSGSYPADSAMLDQMFSDNNVTIAFAGHNHYYCYNTTASGMTYVITGGAGAPLYPTTNGLGTVKYSEYHYVVVNVTDVTVNATMVNMTGSVRHSFQEYGVTQKQTITVPDDYPTIQEAINNANEGDTIFVKAGTYYERPLVNKTVSLVGEDKQNTIIDGNYSGSVVKITKTNDVSLTGFTIRNAGYHWYPSAVFVQNSTGTTLSHNIIDNSSYGIRVYYSNNSTLTDNIVIGHNWADLGIYIHWSNSCIISGNDVSGGWAITIKGSYNSKIMDNMIFAKGKYGIRLGWSHGNLIAYNTILNATAGPPHAPSYGLWSSYYSTDNIIHHNNFLNNSNQAHSHNLTNIWDNGCEGNYWSDYNGTDLDGDGIGDTPYVIDVNNTDNYPLMKPYWDLADIDHDLDVDIFDIVIAAGAYGSTPSDPHWNPHCDIAEPYGIIDIYDIVMICTSYGEEYNL